MKPPSRRSTVDERPALWRRILPGLSVLTRYQRGFLRGDALAGITVAAYLVPQVMAYAVVAGLPPVAGLWACIGPMLVYALIGSSSRLSVGPESSTALMTASGLAALVGGSAIAGPQAYANAAALLAIAVGVVCVVGYLARLGFLASLLSRPVLSGYMAGIAVLMIVSQLGKVTGIKVAGDSLFDRLRSLADQLEHFRWPTAAMALTILVFLLVTRAVWPKLPGPLIAMLAAAGATALFGWKSIGIDTIGAIPRGLPAPMLPNLSGIDVWLLFPAALGIALVGFSDNILTARMFAVRNAEQVHPNQEFLALGAANMAAGVLHGFPVSSSGSRAVIGDSMGARTQAYSLFALAAMILAMFAAGPVLAAFPTAALGGVVIYAAIRLIDIAELKKIGAFRTSELVLAVTTTVAVVIFDVLIGIGIAVGLSLLDLLRRITKPHDGVLGFVPGMAGMHDVADYADAVQVPGLLVYRYDAPLYFANVDDCERRLFEDVDAAEAAGNPVRWVLINTEANVQIDYSACQMLDQADQPRRTRAAARPAGGHGTFRRRLA